MPKLVNIVEFKYLRNIDIYELSVLLSLMGAYNTTGAKRVVKFAHVRY